MIKFVSFICLSVFLSACCVQPRLYIPLSDGMKDWVRYNREDSIVFTSNLSNRDTLYVIEAVDSLFVRDGGGECKPEEVEIRSANVKLSSDSLALFFVQVEGNEIFFRTQDGAFQWNDTEKKFKYTGFRFFDVVYYKSVTIDEKEYNSVFYIPARIKGENAILYYNRALGLFRFATIDKQIWLR